MEAINTVALSGRLTRDAELKSAATGTGVLKFTLAVNERRNINGSWQDCTSFIDCTMFGKRAEAVAERLAKGTQVMVSGRLREDVWEGRDGKRSKVGVIVDNIVIIGGKQAAPQQVEESAQLYDADIPF